MEVIAGHSGGGEFCVSALHTLFVLGRIDSSAPGQSLADRGCRDPVDDDFVVPQGLTVPLQAERRKPSMLARVLQSRPWWDVASPDGQIPSIGEL